MKKKAFIFLLIFLLPAIAWAQEKMSIQGVVYDDLDMTIPGASVVVKGTTTGTVTDIDGKFTIQVARGATLEISFIGYKTQEIRITNAQPLKVVLQEDSQTLDEVVITGYSGKQLRSKSTNSIAKVANEKLTTGAYTNPAQALSGAVSGLRVIQASGSPAATPTIILRGGTNLDGTGSPLIIVDGQVRGSLSDINPEDIEDLQVMKDAGATAIYGARANDGVILVTTKKGKSGKSEINFKAKLGLNFLNNPYEFCNAEDYIYWMRTAYSRSSNMWQRADGSGVGYVSSASLTSASPHGTGNKYFAADGVTPLTNDMAAVYSTMYLDDTNRFLTGKGWKTMTDPVTGKELIFKDTDVREYNFNTPALTQDYNINMSGGNDKGHYYAGLGYNYSEGLPINTFYERYSFVFNGDYKIKPWLTSYSSLNFTRANWENLPGSAVSEYNYFGRILSTPPTVRYEDEEGNPLLGQHYQDGNQQYQPEKFIRDNQSDKFTMNQSFNIDFMKGLSLKLSGNWYYEEELHESFNKDFYQTPTVINTTRSTSSDWYRKFDQTYNAVLNYSNQITPDHYLDAMIGTEYYDSYRRYLGTSGSGAATDDFGDLELTDKGENKRNIDTYHTKERILSYFGRANYDYQSKYLLSVVMRSDGYSRLVDNRWGIFPGVSAGWVFSKEKFMQKYSDILSFGKLRTSFGLNGKVDTNQIGYYTLQGSYSTSSKYDGNTSYVIGSIPNPGLRWEKSRTIEAGLDLSFLENRLNANFTYYNRLTSDKYAKISLPSSSGISSILTNNGKIRNKGIEIDLSAKIIQTKDWNWTVGANIAYNKNIIVSLPNNGLDKNRQDAFQVYSGKGDEKIWVGGYQEGQEPGFMYAFQADGIYKSWDEIPDYLEDRGGGASACVLYGKKSWEELADSEKGTGEEGASKVKKLPIQPGDVKWKDVNGDGVIDQYDMVKVGNTKPRYTGGFNTNLSWKNLRLYAAFDFGLDYKIYDQTSNWFLGCMQGSYNMTTDVKNTWSETNPNGTLPKYYWADQLGKSNYYRRSTMFCYDGSYLAIREISLAYTLPKNWVQKVMLQNVEVSVTGQNLGYITQCALVATPETLAGVAGSGYALPRTLLFGISVTL